MLGLSSISCSPETVATTVAAAAASVLQGGGSPTATAAATPAPQLDKSEINDAVTKVLQGYDWTLVPIASK